MIAEGMFWCGDYVRKGSQRDRVRERKRERKRERER